MAEDLQDVSLMARIEGGYLIVLEAKISLVKLRNQHRLMREIQCSSKSHEEIKVKQKQMYRELGYTFFCNSLNCVPFMNIIMSYRLRDLRRNLSKEKIPSHFPEAQFKLRVME